MNWMYSRTNFTNIAFFLSILIIISVSIVSLVSASDNRRSNLWIRHTYDVMQTNKELLSTIKDAETAHRGYALTGKEEFLNSINEARDESDSIFKRLQSLTSDNLNQQKRCDSLRRLCQRKFTHMLLAVSIRQKQGLDAAASFVALGEGNILMEKINRLASSISLEEVNLLDQRESAAAIAFKRVQVTLILGTFLSCVIIMSVFFALQAQIRRRRKNQEELFVQNQWYTQTLVSLGDGVITTDPEGNVTLMNRAACQITGWRERDAVGKRIDTVVPMTSEVSGETVSNPALDAMKHNAITFLQGSTLMQRRDNTKILIDDSGAPIHDSRGSVIGSVLIFRDITDKRRAEQELSTFHKLSMDLNGIATPEGYFKRVNPSFEKTLGYDAAKFMSTQFTEFVHPEDLETTQQEFRKLVEGHPTSSFVNRYRCADGSYKWLEWNVTPVGESLYATARDITEKHQASEQVKTAYNTFYKILESNPVAILITELSTRKIRYVNDMFCELVGIDREQAVDHSTDEIDVFRQMNWENIQQQILLEGGRARNRESIVVRNEEPIDVLLSVECIEIENDKHCVSSFVDITERKRHEQEINALNQSLEKRVEERTREIIEQKDLTDEILNAIPTEIALYDDKHRYLYVNPAAVPDPETAKWITGRNDNEYCEHVNSDPTIAARRAKAFSVARKQQTAEWIDEVVSPDGTHTYMLRILHRLEKSQRFILTGFDVSDLKIAEQEKEQYIKDLEEMMFITSHKVRHPIAQITGLIHLLEEELTQQELAEVMGYTKDSVQSLDTFTRELTMFIHELRKKNQKD